MTWRKSTFHVAFFEITPFKHYKREERFGYVHMALTILFVGLLVAYAVIVGIQFFTRPLIQTVALKPSSEVSNLKLSVSVTCSAAGMCGTVTVGQNYQSVAGCDTLPSMSQQDPQGPVEVDMCFTPNASPLGVSVQFSFINDSASLVTAAVTIAHDTFSHTVEIDSSQRKTVIAAIQVKMNDTVESGRTFTAQNLQYDGKYGTKAATYNIKLAEFATFVVSAKQGSILETIASVGGAAGLLLSVLQVFTVCTKEEPEEGATGKNKSKSRSSSASGSDAEKATKKSSKKTKRGSKNTAADKASVAV